MKSFTFNLARVAQVRRTQLATEEAKLEQRRSERRAIEAERQQLRDNLENEQQRFRSSPYLRGAGLESFGGFKAAVQREEPRFAADGRIAQQQGEVIECRRRLRLLELLEDRRLSEWKLMEGREMETVVNDFSAAQWLRARSRR